MKNIKKFMRFIIVISLGVFLIGINILTPINAVNNNIILDEEKINYLQDFPNIRKAINRLFNNDNSIKIYDIKGNDVTLEFYENNLNNFNRNDFEIIIKNFVSVSNCLVDNTIQENSFISPQPRLMQNISKRSQLCYTILTINGRLTSSEFAYYVCGRASYNDNTGKYVSVSAPDISVYSMPGIFYESGYSVTGNYGIINNGREVEYKNIVITLWAKAHNQASSVRVYYDPIEPKIILRF